MNLYKISQDVNDYYDTYDSAIVCAETEDEARMIHPSGEEWNGSREKIFDTWCDVKDVQVKIIGAAANNLQKGVILASYNAG